MQERLENKDFDQKEEIVKTLNTGTDEEINEVLQDFYVGVGFDPVRQAAILCGYGKGKELVKQDNQIMREKLSPIMLFTGIFPIKSGCGEKIANWFELQGASREDAVLLAESLGAAIQTITLAWAEGRDPDEAMEQLQQTVQEDKNSQTDIFILEDDNTD